MKRSKNSQGNEGQQYRNSKEIWWCYRLNVKPWQLKQSRKTERPVRQNTRPPNLELDI